MIRAGIDPLSPKMQETLSYLKNQFANQLFHPPSSPRIHLLSAHTFVESGTTVDTHFVKEMLHEAYGLREDGKGWPAAPGQASNAYDTCIAIQSFVKLDKGRKKAATSALKWLTSIQNADGSWGFHESELGNPACTTEVVLLLHRLNPEEERDRIKRAMKYVLSKQRRNGGWNVIIEDNLPFEKPFTRWIHTVTPRAILACMLMGISNPKGISNGLKYLLSSQDRQGGFRGPSDRPLSLWATAQVLIPLVTFLRVFRETDKS